jgi:hypothetical protein
VSLQNLPDEPGARGSPAPRLGRGHPSEPGLTGTVITSAGVVLAATFGVLALLPIVIMIEVGISVALGILLDTLVVRSILVLALSLDIGRWMWWPARLGTSPPEPLPYDLKLPVATPHRRPGEESTGAHSCSVTTSRPGSVTTSRQFTWNRSVP